MHPLKIIFTVIHNAIDSLVTKLQNHQALIRASLSALDARIVDLRNSFESYRHAEGKLQALIPQLEQQQLKLVAQAREKGLNGKRESALRSLLKSKLVRQTIDVLLNQLQLSQSAQIRTRKAIEDLLVARDELVSKQREFVTLESEDIDDLSIDVRALDSLIERSFVELDDYMTVGSIGEATEVAAVSGETRRDLELELETLLGESPR